MFGREQIATLKPFILNEEVFNENVKVIIFLFIFLNHYSYNFKIVIT